MKRATAAAMILGIAAGVNWSLNGGGFGHRGQDPPHTLEPLPLPGSEPRGRKPTTVVFGGDAPRVLRPRIGRDHTAAGIRPHPPGLLYPTDEEFALWLASPTEDLQEFLQIVRGD